MSMNDGMGIMLGYAVRAADAPSSGFLNANGGTIGVLSTVQLAPLAGSNGVGDLPKEIAYMHANAAGFSGVNLVPGTEPFTPGAVGAVLKSVGLQ
jgi:hypothetical protein